MYTLQTVQVLHADLHMLHTESMVGKKIKILSKRISWQGYIVLVYNEHNTKKYTFFKDLFPGGF